MSDDEGKSSSTQSSLSDISDILPSPLLDNSHVFKNKKCRKKFLLSEDMKMINYIIKEGRHTHIKGNSLWKDMVNLKITPHSYMSMRDRFLRKILPNIHQYNINSKQISHWKANVLEVEKSHELEEKDAAKDDSTDEERGENDEIVGDSAGDLNLPRSGSKRKKRILQSSSESEEEDEYDRKLIKLARQDQLVQSPGGRMKLQKSSEKAKKRTNEDLDLVFDESPSKRARQQSLRCLSHLMNKSFAVKQSAQTSACSILDKTQNGTCLGEEPRIEPLPSTSQKTNPQTCLSEYHSKKKETKTIDSFMKVDGEIREDNGWGGTTTKQDLGNLCDMVKVISEEFDLTEREVIYVLWSTSGVIHDAIHYIMYGVTKSGVIPWKQEEDCDISSSDQTKIEKLEQSRGRDAVAARLLFLEKAE